MLAKKTLPKRKIWGTLLEGTAGEGENLTSSQKIVIFLNSTQASYRHLLVYTILYLYRMWQTVELYTIYQILFIFTLTVKNFFYSS